MKWARTRGAARLLLALVCLPACPLFGSEPTESDDTYPWGEPEDDTWPQAYAIMEFLPGLTAPRIDVGARGIVPTNDGFYFLMTDEDDRSYVSKIEYDEISQGDCGDWCYLSEYSSLDTIMAIDADPRQDADFWPMVLFRSTEGDTRVDFGYTEMRALRHDEVFGTLAHDWELSRTYAFRSNHLYYFNHYHVPAYWTDSGIELANVSFMVGDYGRVFAVAGSKIVEIAPDLSYTTTDFAGTGVPDPMVHQLVLDGDEAWAVVGDWLARGDDEGWHLVVDLSEGTNGSAHWRLAVDHVFVYTNYGKAWRKDIGEMCRYLGPPDLEEEGSFEVVYQAYLHGVLGVWQSTAYTFQYDPYTDSEATHLVRLYLQFSGEPFCDPWEPLFDY